MEDVRSAAASSYASVAETTLMPSAFSCSSSSLTSSHPTPSSRSTRCTTILLKSARFASSSMRAPTRLSGYGVVGPTRLSIYSPAIPRLWSWQ